MNNTNFAFDIVAFNSIENILNKSESSNLKSLIIVLDKTALTKESELLLSKILKAVNHNYPEQTYIIDSSNFKQFKILEVFKKTGIHKLLAFGVNPINLGLNLSFKYYSCFEVLNYNLLFSEPLKDLAIKDNSKKMLWSSLKNFFELKTTDAS